MNENVLDRARTGDADALTCLLNHVEPDLRKYVSRETGLKIWPLVEADDVLQVTYFEAFLRIGQFAPNGPGSFLNWLKRIAKNNILDAVRRQGRKRRFHRELQVSNADDAFHLDRLLQLAGSQSSPSRTAARQEANLLLNDALARLPEDYATVVRLADLEKLPMSDVAAAMNRAIGAVRMLRARAHDRLAELMGASSQFFLDGR